MRTLAGLHDRFEETGTKIFGISTDDLETQKRFAESLDLPFALISDADKKMSRAYGALTRLKKSARHAFLIGRDGAFLVVNRSISPDNPADYSELLRAAGATDHDVEI